MDGLHPFNHALVRRADDNAPIKSNSLSSLVSTLIPTLLISGAMVILFLILRRTQRRTYNPRTYLGTLREQERSPELPSGIFNWFGQFFSIPDTYVLNHQSLDGYLLLRFLKIGATICFVGCFLTWPVLFPINITGGAGNQQLDLLSMSNVAPSKKNRYYAHVFVSWVFFGFVLFMIARESIYYINLRQAYLLSPLYANRISSRTVLFTSVPDEYLDPARLRKLFGPAMKNFWISSDCKELAELVKERDSVAFKLEGAETKLITTAHASHLKATKKGGNSDASPTAAEADVEGESGSIAAKYISKKQRPSHKLKFLIGKKVDTIEWSRTELQRILPLVEEQQAIHRSGEAKYVNSVFVEFISQTEAQAAAQSLTHHLPLHMSPRYIGINPQDVIWTNLRIKWWERIVRKWATTSFVFALILFWAIPVAAVGAISNINYLTKKVKFLKFITKIPPVILGVVTGLLPVVALAVLMALLPIILRLMAKLAGAPSRSRVELTVQKSYFAFQVVQVFLVTTVASAATAVAAQISAKPSSALSILATNLPKSSNFYLSYFILQGLTVSSGALLQIVGLILAKVLGKLLDNTPRKMYKRWSTLSSLGWGTVFPIYTLLLVIAITYSIIQPLALGFAAIGLYLIYLAYRYNLLFVFDTNIDTQGLVYTQALQQTLVGIYLCEGCLLGLFIVGKAAGPAILEALFIVFTIIFHTSLNSAISPCLEFLPKSLATEEEALLKLEGGHTNGEHPAAAHSNVKTEPVVEGESATASDEANAAPHKKPNFLTKWLHPEKYTDYQTLRRLVPRNFLDGITLTEEHEKNAYYDPAIASPTPLLWIPRDPLGISKQEVAHTSKVLPITDEGAILDEKNKIVTDQEQQPPIYEEKVYY